MTDGATLPFLQGGGECGALLRQMDWSRHPLGHPAEWPDELAVLAGIVLASAQPMFIVWGPDRITLYNDAYSVIAGKRHPAGLGRPIHEMWFDIWNDVGPLIAAAYQGVGTAKDELQLMLHRNGYPEKAHFTFSYNPVRDRNGQVVGMLCACLETTASVALRDAQQAERRDFLQVFEVALGAVALLDGPDHVFRFVNSDYVRLVGRHDIIGKTVREGLPEIVDQGFIAILDKVFRTGESHIGRNIPVTLQSSPDAAPREHFLDYLFHPIRDDAGAITGIFVQALDVSERVDEEKRRQMILGELSHRMKNQLAMIQAIVNQTLRTATDLATASEVLGDRIRVLSGAHDILIRGHADSTMIGDIVAKVLALHQESGQARFRVEGPPLSIASRPALSLSLVLHELSTNAVKYGALSNNAGLVHIRWEVVSDVAGNDRFVLTWTEEGGPPVIAPRTLGSGSRLIRAGLSGTTDCEVEIDYHPTGLLCRISADLRSVHTAN